MGAVHAIAVPEADMLEKSGKICVVARGDGVVDVIDIGSELAAAQSKSSLKAHKGSKSRSKNNASTAAETLNQNRRRLHLDYTLGGHLVDNYRPFGDHLPTNDIKKF